MSAELQTLQEQLHDVLTRLERLEDCIQGEPLPRWRFLVARSHPWRRQLSLKGRNLTVGQLLSTMRANRLSPEQAAADLELPLEAIQEALAYAEENRALLELEVNEERRRLRERGYALEPSPLPR